MGSAAIPHDRGGFETTLDMLRRVAVYLWTTAEWLKTTPLGPELALGVWQAPRLLCTMHACLIPPSYLLLRWWPLTIPGEAARFLYEGEPDGDPQAVLRIGFGELPEEEQWPQAVREIVSRKNWQKNKIKSQRWNFPPDGLDPLMEESQRAVRASKARWRPRAQQESAKVRLQETEQRRHGYQHGYGATRW